MIAQKVSNFTRGGDPYRKLQIGDNNLAHWRNTWNNKAIYRWLFWIEPRRKIARKGRPNHMRYVLDLIYSKGTEGQDILWFHETLLDGSAPPDRKLDQKEVLRNNPKMYFDSSDVTTWNDSEAFRDFVTPVTRKKVESMFSNWYEYEKENPTGLELMIKIWMNPSIKVMATEHFTMVKNPGEPQYFEPETELKEL